LVQAESKMKRLLEHVRSDCATELGERVSLHAETRTVNHSG
jgi:hypothetical protein